MAFVIVQRNPNAAVFSQQFMQEFQARIHHRQPQAVLQIIVVMFKSFLCIVRRVDTDTFDTAGIKRQQGFQCVQIVALNNEIVAKWLIYIILRGGVNI